MGDIALRAALTSAALIGSNVAGYWVWTPWNRSLQLLSEDPCMLAPSRVVVTGGYLLVLLACQPAWSLANDG